MQGNNKAINTKSIKYMALSVCILFKNCFQYFFITAIGMLLLRHFNQHTFLFNTGNLVTIKFRTYFFLCKQSLHYIDLTSLRCSELFVPSASVVAIGSPLSSRIWVIHFWCGMSRDLGFLEGFGVLSLMDASCDVTEPSQPFCFTTLVILFFT